MNLIECIISKKYDDANDIVSEKLNLFTSLKLSEMRKIAGARMVNEEELDEEELDEEEQLDEARFKIVKARVRGGKIQRRRKISTVKGYTFRSGKLTRMSPQERRRRKMGQRRGKIKRKAKLSRALMKRKRSMMKRKAMGLR